MNSLSEKNALLSYTKDTLHVQSANNFLRSEDETPNTKRQTAAMNLERVWAPNKFNPKKAELTLALDQPTTISWSSMKQHVTLEDNETNTKQPPLHPASLSVSLSPSTLTSNLANSDDDDDDDGPISSKHSPEVSSPTSPLHHARRPMNAFLIFCKKHRPVVRRKFLTLENRAVTKILGEWWALLDAVEKDAYTSLAKEYKDAFFSAHPNFKWYKLPAPPLRTLHTRPTNLQCGSGNAASSPLSPTQTATAGHILLCSPTSAVSSSLTTQFTPGKLADESQLGKLSSLLNLNSTSTNNNNSIDHNNHNNNNYATQNNNNTAASYPPYPSGIDSPVNNNVSLTDDVTPPLKPIKKRDFVPDELTFDGSRVARNLFEEDEEDKCEERKVGRKCKGQRYKEFMINGKLLKNKRDKLSEDDGDDYQADQNSQDNSLSARPQHHIDLDTTIKLLAERTHTRLPETRPKQQQQHQQQQQFDNTVDYDSASSGNTFNLDDKIAQLPCLSYDMYMRRKRESKKRKFNRNNKMAGLDSHKNKRSAKVDSMETVTTDVTLVGSKKRKNKQNITHLEKGKDAKVTDCKAGKVVDEDVNVVPDLFGLATLAEIAANKEKLNQD